MDYIAYPCCLSYRKRVLRVKDVAGLLLRGIPGVVVAQQQIYIQFCTLDDRFLGQFLILKIVALIAVVHHVPSLMHRHTVSLSVGGICTIY